MKTPLPSNRRRTTRSSVDLDAQMHGAGAVQLSRLTDISLDGAFLDAGRAALGAKVTLSLGLDDGKPAVLAEGVVVRDNAGGVGVRFTAIRTRDRVRIAEKIFGE